MGESNLEEEEDEEPSNDVGNDVGNDAIPEAVQALFHSWDTDGSGLLDVDKLGAGMAASGMSRKAARRILKIADLNRDEQLDMQEFADFIVSKTAPQQFKDLCDLTTSIPARGTRFGVGVSWDAEGTIVDVDLQAVIIDEHGRCVDAVFYNNLKAQRGALTHSGDEDDGDKTGIDEAIWATLARIPAKIQLIVFVVAAHHGGSLGDVSEGWVHILRDNPSQEVCKMTFEKSTEEVDVIGALERRGNGWVFQPLACPAADGHHFMDILEPTIGSYVRRKIDNLGNSHRLKAAFDMKKAGVVDFPELNTIRVGLGWADCGIDLDVTAVLFTAAHECKDACFYGNLETSGLKHHGDNLTGAGDGDDEEIDVNLTDIPDDVVQVIFMICIYTRNQTFERVDDCYCRVLAEGEELCKFTVDGTPDEESDPEGEIDVEPDKEGLIIARITRDAGRWSFQACPTPIDGRTYQEAMPQLKALARVSPKAYAKIHSN